MFQELEDNANNEPDFIFLYQLRQDFNLPVPEVEFVETADDDMIQNFAEIEAFQFDEEDEMQVEFLNDTVLCEEACEPLVNGNDEEYYETTSLIEDNDDLEELLEEPDDPHQEGADDIAKHFM